MKLLYKELQGYAENKKRIDKLFEKLTAYKVAHFSAKNVLNEKGELQTGKELNKLYVKIENNKFFRKHHELKAQLYSDSTAIAKANAYQFEKYWRN